MSKPQERTEMKARERSAQTTRRAKLDGARRDRDQALMRINRAAEIERLAVWEAWDKTHREYLKTLASA